VNERADEDEEDERKGGVADEKVSVSAGVTPLHREDEEESVEKENDDGVEEEEEARFGQAVDVFDFVVCDCFVCVNSARAS